MLTDMLLKRVLKFGIVFTSTRHNGGYDYLPERFVYDGFNQEHLDNYIKFLVRIKDSGKVIPENFIVFDDIVSSINQSSRAWNEFIATYRHYNITLLVTTQHINRCAPMFREQAEHTYIFSLHTLAALKSSYESYGQLFPRLKNWTAFLTKHTEEEYKAVVWSKESRPKVELKYKTVRAPSKRREVKFEF
jgi:hypothetical protein